MDLFIPLCLSPYSQLSVVRVAAADRVSLVDNCGKLIQRDFGFTRLEVVSRRLEVARMEKQLSSRLLDTCTGDNVDRSWKAK